MKKTIALILLLLGTVGFECAFLGRFVHIPVVR